MKKPMKRLVYLYEMEWCEPSKAAPECQIHSGSSNTPKMVGYKTIAMSRQVKSNKEIVQAYNWLRKKYVPSHHDGNQGRQYPNHVF